MSEEYKGNVHNPIPFKLIDSQITARLLERFLQKVKVVYDDNGNEQCWIWAGARNEVGYGRFWVSDNPRLCSLLRRRGAFPELIKQRT